VRLPTPALAAALWAMPGPPVKDWVARMLQTAPGSPAAVQRRKSSCEQKKGPVETIWVTARPAVGREILGRHREVGRRVVDQHPGRPESPLEGVEGTAICSG